MREDQRIRRDEPTPNSLWERVGWNSLKRRKNNWLDSRLPDSWQEGFEKLEVATDAAPAKINSGFFGKDRSLEKWARLEQRWNEAFGVNRDYWQNAAEAADDMGYNPGNTSPTEIFLDYDNGRLPGGVNLGDVEDLIIPGRDYNLPGGGNASLDQPTAQQEWRGRIRDENLNIPYNPVNALIHGKDMVWGLNKATNIDTENVDGTTGEEGYRGISRRRFLASMGAGYAGTNMLTDGPEKDSEGPVDPQPVDSNCESYSEVWDERSQAQWERAVSDLENGEDSIENIYTESGSEGRFVVIEGEGIDGGWEASYDADGLDLNDEEVAELATTDNYMAFFEIEEGDC